MDTRENTRAVPRWVREAMQRAQRLRRKVRLNCYPYHHWPILMFEDDTYLPVDRPDFRRAANDL